MKTTIPSDVWESKKDEISNLYKVEEWPLKQVIKKVRTDNFDPTETQLRSRLKKWGVTKPSRRKRKKPTSPPNELRVVTDADRSRARVTTNLAPSDHREVPAHTSPSNSDRWVFPPTPSQNYLLESPAFLENSQMHRNFSMQSSSIAVSGDGGPIHPMQQPSFPYNTPDSPFGQPFPIPRSICDTDVATAIIDPSRSSQPFCPSTAEYSTAASPHMQPHDRGPPEDPPLLLPPSPWTYPSPEQPLYNQVPNSSYIPSDHSQPLLQDQNPALHPYEKVTLSDTEGSELMPNRKAWKRASTLVDAQGNFIGNARVTYRPPRLRKCKADGKSTTQHWDARRLYSQLQSPRNAVMATTAHPPLAEPSVHSEMQFSGNNGEYILPTSSSLGINQR